jgi:hypothetical protein
VPKPPPQTARPAWSPVDRPRKRKAAAAAAPPVDVRPPSDRPLWLILSEPGLADLALRELKARKVVARKARATKLFLRNYDLLVLPDSQIQAKDIVSRLAFQILSAPVFGRGAFNEGQLLRLTAAWKRERADGLVSTIAGNHFQRQDLTRWLAKQLKARGVEADVDGKPERPAWLIAVDQAFYVAFPRFNHHDAPGRSRDEDRVGALPPTVGAAMVFAAKPETGEVIWDPVAGSGALLREAAEMAPGATLIGTDVDAQAIALAGRRLGAHAQLQVADATTVDLDRQDVTLTLANLPWGKRYEAAGGNAALYEALIRNILAHAAAGWRGVFITSDLDALRRATRAVGGLVLEGVAEVKVRGIDAGVWLLRRAG